MARLFGQRVTRESLGQYAGSIRQVAGIEVCELTDGPGRGMRAAHVRTGGGLTYTVVADRCMDITAAHLGAYPLAWLTPAAHTSPQFFESQGAEWLRTFQGGLVATCGLRNVGVACVDGAGSDPEAFGVHGRIGCCPARGFTASEGWVGDDYVMALEGTMTEWRLFGEHLTLRRRIVSRLGENTITLTDTLSNRSERAEPTMLLYHMNLGWPLIDEGTATRVEPGSVVTPRDEAAAPGVSAWMQVAAPSRGYREQVFYHDVTPDAEGLARVVVTNPRLGLSLAVEYRACSAEGSPGVGGLGCLTQWKQFGEGAYVLGVEPANCRVGGRAAERARGAVVELEPGEEVSYEFSLHASLAE